MPTPFFRSNLTAEAASYIDAIAETEAEFRERARSNFLRMLKLPTDLPVMVALEIAQYATNPQLHCYVGATGADRRDPCRVCRSTDRYAVQHGGIPEQTLSTDIGG